MYIESHLVAALQSRWPTAGPPLDEWFPEERSQDVDTNSAVTRLEAALTSQLALAGADRAVESAAQSLLDALGPAVRQLATDLAEQAAVELAAQLPEYQVDVVLREGEPALAVHPRAGSGLMGDDYEARITLRLPSALKSLVEEAAGGSGESINSWVVRALSGVAQRGARPGRRVSGVVRT
jgi:hypothetical protein